MPRRAKISLFDGNALRLWLLAALALILLALWALLLRLYPPGELVLAAGP